RERQGHPSEFHGVRTIRQDPRHVQPGGSAPSPWRERVLGSAPSQPGSIEEGVMPTGAEADVLKADDRRFEAMQKKDWTALDGVLADDLTYVHSTARLES